MPYWELTISLLEITTEPGSKHQLSRMRGQQQQQRHPTYEKRWKLEDPRWVAKALRIQRRAPGMSMMLTWNQKGNNNKQPLKQQQPTLFDCRYKI